MKGFVIEIGLIGIIFTISCIMFILIPVIFTKTHLVEVLILQYKYDNAQLALLSALSITSQDTLDNKVKPASEIIGEYVAMPSSRNSISLEFLKTSLDKMVSNNIIECYKLSSTAAGDLATNTVKCQPDKYSAKAKIALPYNTQTFTDLITLVMN